MMGTHRSSLGSSGKKGRPKSTSRSQSAERSESVLSESPGDHLVVDDVTPVLSFPDCFPQPSNSPADIERDKKIEAQFAVQRGPTTTEDRCARVRRFNFDDERTGHVGDLPSDVILPPALSATSSRKRKATASPIAASPTPAKFTAVQTEPLSQPSTVSRRSAARRSRGDERTTTPKSPEDGGLERTSGKEEPASSPSSASIRPATARRRSQGARLSSDRKDTAAEWGEESEAASKPLVPSDSEGRPSSSASASPTSVDAKSTASTSASALSARRSVRPRKQTTKAAESFEVVAHRRRSHRSSPSGASTERIESTDSAAAPEEASLQTPAADDKSPPSKDPRSPKMTPKPRASPVQTDRKTPQTPSSEKTAVASQKTSQKSPASQAKSPKSAENISTVQSGEATKSSPEKRLPKSPVSPRSSASQRASLTPVDKTDKQSPVGQAIESLVQIATSPQTADRDGTEPTAQSTTSPQQRSIADELLDDWTDQPPRAIGSHANDMSGRVRGERAASATDEGMEEDRETDGKQLIGADDHSATGEAVHSREGMVIDAARERERATSTASIDRPAKQISQQADSLDADWLNEFTWLKCEDGVIYCAVCTLFNETKQQSDEFTEGLTAQLCTLERIKAHDVSEEHKTAEAAQEKDNEKTGAEMSEKVAKARKAKQLKRALSVGEAVVRLQDIKKESPSSTEPGTPSDKDQKPAIKKWQTSEKERGRVMRKVNEIMVGREDFLVVDGDFAYCKVCRHYATEGGSKGNQWVRGTPIGSVATVVAHENTAPHRKKIAQYYAEVLKMPMPASGGRLSMKHEIRCSYEGCEKTFRSLDMMGAHVRHSHQPKDADGVPIAPLPEVKTPAATPRPALVGHARHSTTTKKPSLKSPKKTSKKAGQPPVKKPRRIINSSESEADNVGEENEDVGANAFDSDDYEPEREEKVSSDEAMSSDEDGDNNGDVNVDGEEEEEDDEDQTDTGSEDGQERSRSSVSELGSEDVIRCQCQDNVENGFMLQCDRCKTWQHGDCVGISKQQTPELYICYVCVDPPKIRSSRRYTEKVREEYVGDGLLPSLGLTPAAGDANGPAPMPSRAPIMIRTHALKSRALEMYDRLRSIKVRMRVGCDPSYVASLPADARPETALKEEITQMQDDVEERLVELANELGAAEKFWYAKFSAIGERESSAAMSKNLLDLTKDLKKIKKMALLSR
uniref:C2H2-type domain-containing protein n=1 Tax=Plectus sambesii TaxID=2011161 RepID=A0A914VUC1_9BILA